MKTLIIGLGNPILGDDGVGWHVAEEVARLIPSPLLPRGEGEIEIDCLSIGGLSLMERMLGYQRVILVDSMETGQAPEGSVKAFPLIALANPMASHSASVHDTSLMTALQTAQAMDMDVPSVVDVVAIEARNVYDFSETLSPAVERAVPVAAQKVLNLLKEELV